MDNYKIGSITSPAIIQSSCGLERLSFSEITQDLYDQSKSLFNSTTVISMQEIILNFSHILHDIQTIKSDIWSTSTDWKQQTEFEICNKIYYLLFTDNKYNSYCTTPIFYDDNYTLPVKVICDKYGKLLTITVTDKIWCGIPYVLHK